MKDMRRPEYWLSTIVSAGAVVLAFRMLGTTTIASWTTIGAAVLIFVGFEIGRKIDP